MYFLEKIKNEYKDEDVVLFVDMDGVIADYDFGNAKDFHKKRPVRTNINTFLELSKEKNIELCILSVCRTNEQIKEKNVWLDQYASFFKEDKRFVLSKEVYDTLSSKEIKANFLKDYIKKKLGKKIVVVDDDNGILKYYYKVLPEIRLFQDSSIID